MPIQDDPLAKYRVTTEKPKNDPLAKYRISEPSKIEEVKTEEVKTEEPKAEESWWDWLTRSRLPEELKSKGSLNFDNKNPNTLLKPETGAEPDTYSGGWGKGLQESLYENVARPMASPLGAVVAVAGGPITRGVLGAAARIPGVSKLAQLGMREVLPGEAPAFVKETVKQLTPKGKPNTPVTPPPGNTPVATPTPNPSGAVEKLKEALKEVIPLSREQRKILSSERAAKFSEARKVDVTDEGSANAFLGQFKGEHTKLAHEPLKLEQPDIDELHAILGNQLKTNKVAVTEGAQTIVSLKKLFSGEVLNPSEIEVLGRVYGKDLMDAIPRTSTNREIILRTANIAKSMLSAIDFGLPFRQGFNHVGQKEWFGMFRPMVESYFSENWKNQWIDALKSVRNYDYARTSGLGVYDDIATGRREFPINSFVQNIPGVKHSNRANIAGISKLRIDLFNTLYDDYLRQFESSSALAAGDKNLLGQAETLNPQNPYVGRKIADLVNTSTGKGHLGRGERIAEELNAAFFSPQLISSRIRSINRVANPLSYVNKDPVELKYALKQLASMVGTTITTATLLNKAGAEIGLDPNSSDFLKGKFGNVRMDMNGGYPQYFVPLAKIIMGKAVSTKTGKSYDLGSNPVVQDRWDVLESFFVNKESPGFSLFTAMMKGREPSGKVVDYTSLDPTENTLMKSTLVPIMIQSFKELAEEDPSLLPLLTGAMFGGSVDTYDSPSGSRTIKDR